MSVFVRGLGAVSPAGWGVEALRDALMKRDPLPVTSLERPGWTAPLPVRVVPPPTVRPPFLAHPRLRRASPITTYAVAAALEAVGPDAARVRDGSLRLGLVLCVMAGCVNYTRRFYQEVAHDPATASPLLFPETVFNAPASHLATLLGSAAACYTLVGDPGMFLAGLALAAHWIVDHQVDVSLVVGAEEIDWLVADASRCFDRHTVTSEGAGAVYLSGPEETRPTVQLSAVTDAHSYLRHRSRAEAAAAMRAQLPRGTVTDLLCDSQHGSRTSDQLEQKLWHDWKGHRSSPKLILGESYAAGSAWQCVAAVDGLKEGPGQSALVSVLGCNQQAIGGCFRKV